MSVCLTPSSPLFPFPLLPSFPSQRKKKAYPRKCLTFQTIFFWLKSTEAHFSFLSLLFFLTRYFYVKLHFKSWHYVVLFYSVSTVTLGRKYSICYCSYFADDESSDGSYWVTHGEWCLVSNQIHTTTTVRSACGLSCTAVLLVTFNVVT